MSSSNLVWIILVLVVILVVGWVIFKQILSKGDQVYRPCGPLLTEREKYIFQIVQSLNIGKCFVKVRVADIITTDKWEYIYSNKITQKHIDILIVNDQYLPLLAIEVQDSTHHTSLRKKRDKFIEKVFKEVHVPLVFVWGNNREKIAELIQSTLQK